MAKQPIRREFNFVHYEEIKPSNSIIIGINHTSNLDVPDARPIKSELIRTIQNSNHIIFEGNEYSHGLDAPYPSAEAYALRTAHKGSKNIIYLEEGVFFADILQEQSTNLSLAAISTAAGIFYVCLQYTRDPEVAVYHSQNHLVSIAGNPMWNKFTLEKALRPFLEVLQTHSDQTDYKWVEYLTAFQHYFEQTRDAKIICPRAIEISRALGGRKAFVIGQNHFDNVSRAIKNGYIPSAPRWEEFCRTLPAEQIAVLKDFEEAAATIK